MKASDWISVKDRLPKMGERAMVCQSFNDGRNWVYEGERTQFPMQVVALGKDWAHLDFPGNEGGVWEAGIKDLRPIPITKEVLRRVGFRWDGGYGHKQLDDAKTMQYYKHESRLRVWYKTEDIIFECHGVYYLHQLQNAYYMATGEELQIEL